MHLKGVVEAMAESCAVAVVDLVGSWALLVIGLCTHQLGLGDSLLRCQLLHGEAAHQAILIQLELDWHIHDVLRHVGFLGVPPLRKVGHAVCVEFVRILGKHRSCLCL